MIRTSILKLGLITVILTSIITDAMAQRIKTYSGDIKALIGEKELSVTFGYDMIKVHGYETEEEFIVDKVSLRERKNPGTGEQFRGSWYADRDTVYEPLFIKYFNEKLPKKRRIHIVENNPEATYNLHVETLWVYPGYNVGFSQPAKIEVSLKIYEIANPQNVVWQAKSPLRVEAKVAPYKRELRIGAAYAALSYSLSWYLRRELK